MSAGRSDGLSARFVGHTGKRGPGVFRYTRATLARLAGVTIGAVYSAERRGRLDVASLSSVAAWLARTQARAERRRQREGATTGDGR